jgi:hypothetical protein
MEEGKVMSRTPKGEKTWEKEGQEKLKSNCPLHHLP